MDQSRANRRFRSTPKHLRVGRPPRPRWLGTGSPSPHGPSPAEAKTSNWNNGVRKLTRKCVQLSNDSENGQKGHSPSSNPPFSTQQRNGGGERSMKAYVSLNRKFHVRVHRTLFLHYWTRWYFALCYRLTIHLSHKFQIELTLSGIDPRPCHLCAKSSAEKKGCNRKRHTWTTSTLSSHFQIERNRTRNQPTKLASQKHLSILYFK